MKYIIQILLTTLCLSSFSYAQELVEPICCPIEVIPIDLIKEESNTVYVKFLCGPNFLNKAYVHNFSPKFKTGYLVSGTLGYRFRPNFSAEVEYAFRHNTTRWLKRPNYSSEYNGNLIKYTCNNSIVMVNVVWDLINLKNFIECQSLTPFIAVGVGPYLHGSNNTIAIQVKWGTRYSLNEKSDISLECILGAHSSAIGLGISYKFSPRYK